MQRVRFVSAVAAAVVAAVFGLPGTAHASKTVKATVAASCPGGQIAVGGRFTVTSALSNTTPISINTEVQTLNRTPSSTSGSTNTYDGPFDGLLIAGNVATTTVADNWPGKFELVSLTCRAPATPTVAVQASLPGVALSIHVTVTNQNDVMLEYEVTVGSLGAKKVKVLGRGGSAAVDFTTPTCSTTYPVTVKDNIGAQQTASATMPACPPGPQPSVSPSPSKSTPHASASASASPSASTPNPSELATVDSGYVEPSAEGGVDPNALPAKPKHSDNRWSVMGYKSMWTGLGLLLFVTIGAVVVVLRRNRSSGV